MTTANALDWEALLARLAQRVGSQTTPTETEVEKGMIRRFAAAIGATSPLYHDEAFARASRYGALIAPPTFASTFVVGHFPQIFEPVPEHARLLHSDDRARLARPIRAGETIRAVARYAGAVRKEGRQGPMLFQSADLLLDAADGERVAEVRIVSVSF